MHFGYGKSWKKKDKGLLEGGSRKSPGMILVQTRVLAVTYKTSYKKQMKKSKVLSQHICHLLYCVFLFIFFNTSLRITAAYYSLNVSNFKPVGEGLT